MWQQLNKCVTSTLLTKTTGIAQAVRVSGLNNIIIINYACEAHDLLYSSLIYVS